MRHLHSLDAQGFPVKKRSGYGRPVGDKRRPPGPVREPALRELSPRGRRAHADGIIGILVRHRKIKAPR
jgi:hypothetical protein